MSPETVIDLANKTIYTTLIISAPILGIALIVGLLISIFQAVTQIQEMTLTFVPKMVATLLAMIFFGPWLFSILLSFTLNLYNNIPNYIK